MGFGGGIALSGIYAIDSNFGTFHAPAQGGGYSLLMFDHRRLMSRQGVMS